MSGKLTTHVLDTANGRPAPGVEIELYRVENENRILLATARTNAGGRTDAPLLEDEALVAGVYELVFAVGEYFVGEALPAPPFLDRVPLRFGVADPGAHYHVPLLVSPWSYSTYRGS